MAENQKVRIQVLVDRADADRLDALGLNLGMSRTSVAEWIIQMGVSEEEWLMNKLSTWVAGKVLKAFGKNKGVAVVQRGEA